jgi:hypothetical protein
MFDVLFKHSFPWLKECSRLQILERYQLSYILQNVIPAPRFEIRMVKNVRILTEVNITGKPYACIFKYLAMLCQLQRLCNSSCGWVNRNECRRKRSCLNLRHRQYTVLMD